MQPIQRPSFPNQPVTQPTKSGRESKSTEVLAVSINADGSAEPITADDYDRFRKEWEPAANAMSAAVHWAREMQERVRAEAE